LELGPPYICQRGINTGLRRRINLKSHQALGDFGGQQGAKWIKKAGLFGISRGVGLLYYQQVISTYEFSNLLRSESTVGQTFEIPLDIPDVTIESVATNRMGHIEITLKSTVEGTLCRQCGKMTTTCYGEDREIT